MTQKFIDKDGLKVLWNQVNLKDYPNNETLMAVIDAIDETKADKNELFSKSWNDLTDRPFYEKDVKTNIIEWDRDNGDRVTSEDGVYAKMSDYIPTEEELKLCVYTDLAYGEIAIADIYEDMLANECITDDYVMELNGGKFVIAKTPNVDVYGSIFPETGLYFANTVYYISRFESPTPIFPVSYELKQLDEKFIPDTIAKVENVVQSDWEEDDNTVLSHIKNRPMYDEPISPFITIGELDSTEPCLSANVPVLIQEYDGMMVMENLYDKYSEENTHYTQYNCILKTQSYHSLTGHTTTTEVLNDKDNYSYIDNKNFIYKRGNVYKVVFIKDTTLLSEEDLSLYPTTGVYIVPLRNVSYVYVKGGIVVSKTLKERFIDSEIARKEWVEGNSLSLVNANSALQSYSPTNELDIATKKYVDESVKTNNSTIESIKASLNNYYLKTEADALHTEIEQYVDSEIADLVGAAPETLNTIEELATAFEENAEIVEVLNTAITNKADKIHVHSWNEIENKPFTIAKEYICENLTDRDFGNFYYDNELDATRWTHNLSEDEYQLLLSNVDTKPLYYKATHNGTLYEGIVSEYRVDENSNLIVTEWLLQESRIGFKIENNILYYYLGAYEWADIDFNLYLTGDKEYINEESIPNTIARIEDIPEVSEQVQSDWNQNDETTPGYIKNRPFWFDEEEVDILPETTLTIDPESGMAIFETNVTLSIGQICIITYNGAAYECVANEFVEEDGASGISLGNIGALTGENMTEEPFLILLTDVLNAVAPLDGNESFTLSIRGGNRTYHKIPNEYLPKFSVNIVDGVNSGSTRAINSCEEDSDYWLGTNATALGKDTKASGNNSHAEGQETTASGTSSHAEGSLTIASGTNSHAEGYYTKAEGEYSHAEGHLTTASDANSHAEGYGTTALSNNSHAEGQGTTASGTSSHAEGYYTTAQGDYSHAEGYYTTALGNNSHAESVSSNTLPNEININSNNDDIINVWKNKNFTLAKGEGSHAEGKNTLSLESSSHAEGNGTIASGNSSHAEGSSTVASGINSHTEGQETTAEGKCSHAEGYSTKAEGEYSHAEGDGTVASGANSHAEGDHAVASGTSSHAEGYYTTASSNYAHAEGCSAKAEGKHSHAEGSSTTAQGDYSHAEGGSTKAEGESSHAEGYGTVASGASSHTEGQYTKASNNYSHAEGSATEAQGESSHAEGYHTVASGANSHAEGNYTEAQGDYSHAEGGKTVAQGEYSHAEGYYTTAQGDYSHAEGYLTTAEGEYSHTEGYNTRAEGEYSHVEGYYTRAMGDYSHVQGKYNIASNIGYAHIVGNGTDIGACSNAHTLDWEGNAWYAGDVYVGSTSGTDKDDGSKKLATEDYVSTELNNYYLKSEADTLHAELHDYVDTEVAALVNAAPETLDTLGELAQAFEENKEVVEALDASITNKQDKVSDTLILVDTVTGIQHKIQIQNGQLVSFPIE